MFKMFKMFKMLIKQEYQRLPLFKNRFYGLDFENNIYFCLTCVNNENYWKSFNIIKLLTLMEKEADGYCLLTLIKFDFLNWDRKVYHTRYDLFHKKKDQKLISHW